jgi:hypothetical protein
MDSLQKATDLLLQNSDIHVLADSDFRLHFNVFQKKERNKRLFLKPKKAHVLD